MLVTGEVEVNHVRLAICPVRRRGLRPRSVLWNLVAMAVNYIVAWLRNRDSVREVMLVIALQASPKNCMCRY